MNIGISTCFFPIFAVLLLPLHILGFGHNVCTAADEAPRRVLSVSA